MLDADYRVGRIPAIEHDWPSIMRDAVDRAAANMKKASESYSIGRPYHWVPFINTATSNERSKPMGLTKEHHYEDADGDTILVQDISASSAKRRGATALLQAAGGGTFVEPGNSVPLALNVLGYDRPGAGDGSSVSADGFFVPGIRIQGDAQRAELAAKAISYLKSVDIYDQQAAERKAKEAEEAAAKAAELAAAKAWVEVANREIAERLLRKAKAAYQGAIIDAYKLETTPEVTAKLQAALSAYETARRKFEGLPN